MTFSVLTIEGTKKGVVEIKPRDLKKLINGGGGAFIRHRRVNTLPSRVGEVGKISPQPSKKVK